MPAFEGAHAAALARNPADEATACEHHGPGPGLRHRRDRATAEELSAHCHQRIAGYKRSRTAEFREAPPMTGAGKIQKTALRKPFREGRSRAVN